jgi:ketosteroid isomerase-like protein
MKNMPCLFVMLLVASANAGELRSDEKQILRLEDDWVRAMNVKDRKTLDRILAPEFTFIEPDGTIKERAEYLADRTNEVVETESFNNAGLKISLFGTAALASGVATITERHHGKRYHFSARWKELWLKRNGSWQVIASQATPVNPNWQEPFLARGQKP